MQNKGSQVLQPATTELVATTDNGETANDANAYSNENQLSL